MGGKGWMDGWLMAGCGGGRGILSTTTNSTSSTGTDVPREYVCTCMQRTCNANSSIIVVLMQRRQVALEAAGTSERRISPGVARPVLACLLAYQGIDARGGGLWRTIKRQYEYSIGAELHVSDRY